MLYYLGFTNQFSIIENYMDEEKSVVPSNDSGYFSASESISSISSNSSVESSSNNTLLSNTESPKIYSFFKQAANSQKIGLALSLIGLIAGVLALILLAMPPVIFGLLIAATVASALMMIVSAEKLTCS